MKYTPASLFSCIYCFRRYVLRLAGVTLVLSGLAAVLLTGGCAHPGQTLEPSTGRIERELAQAAKAASEVSDVADIAMRATENAEAYRIAAMKLLAGLTATGSVERVAAMKSLREAEKSALEAGRMAMDAARHAGNVTNAAVTMKQLAGQAVDVDTLQRDRILVKMQNLGGQCVKEAVAARKLSDELKKKWLSLSPDDMRLMSPTNSITPPVSNGVVADSGL